MRRHALGRKRGGDAERDREAARGGDGPGDHHYGTLDHVDVARKLALLGLRLLTGRTHQLRVHCARGLGAPILGDVT